MSRFGETFDHNIHALRIVEHFEQRYARFPGLNLTFEVREVIVKHSRDLTPGEHPELDEYHPELRPPLEAQLIDLTDEIAYDCADLDDGYAAGILGFDEMRQVVPTLAEIFETVETQYPGATEREQFHEGLRTLLDGLVSGLIQGTASAAQSAGVRNSEEVRQYSSRIACYTESARDAVQSLKSYLRRRLYCSPVLDDDRTVSTQRMGRMFDYLLLHPERLHVKAMPLHRAVCDYIAGMTDVYFHRTYEDIFGA
jgi:dGTPase